MEVVRASVTSAVARAPSASGLVADSSAVASSSQASVKALCTRKSLSCQGLSCSTTSGSSFWYNALAVKVSQLESGTTGHRGVVTMKTKTAAGGYASALAELARATDNLDAIHKDVENFGEILKNPEIYDFLVSPVVADEKKKSILKTLSDDAKFNPFTLNFLNIMIDKKRINLINEVVKEFATRYYEFTDTQLATVASAVRIEKAQLALIAKKIQSLSGAKNVRIKNVIDPSLIAGFIVKYGKDGSRLVDMSVKGQLDRLAYQFEYAEKVEA